MSKANGAIKAVIPKIKVRVLSGEVSDESE
jgi:hypothetical protein